MSHQDRNKRGTRPDPPGGSDRYGRSCARATETDTGNPAFLGWHAGRLYSYVIHHRPVPGFTPPYAIAVVELDEGPRMMSNIVDCPQTPEALELDMKLEVAFEKLDDEITLPLFRPAKG
jgi:hypothetical protein